MTRTLVLLIANLILFGLLSANALACGGNCAGCCGSPSSFVAAQEPVVIQIHVKALPLQAASLLAKSVKRSVKLTARLPHEMNKQMQAGTDNAQVAFRVATGQTQSTFQRISAEVTSLSLKFLRGASSYFLALLSGLLR